MIDADNLGVKHDNNSTNGTVENGLHHDSHHNADHESSETPLHDSISLANGTNTVVKEENEASADDGVSQRPYKKRKLHGSAPRSRVASPPWNFGDEPKGPSTFVVDGRRKSSRFNTVPPELQPDTGKRKTRASAKVTQSNGASKSGPLQNGSKSNPAPSPAPIASKTKRPQSSGKGLPQLSQVSPPRRTPRRTPRRVSSVADASQRSLNKSVNGHTRTPSKPDAQPYPSPKAHRRRRSTIVSQPPTNDLDSPSSDSDHHELDFTQLPSPGPTKRLRLKLRVPRIPVTQPTNIPPQKKYASFEEWLEHDDPLAGEENQRITWEEARKEANIRLSILQAAVPGGVLSEERCSRYLPDPPEEPPPKYGHWDHVAHHAVYFQKLLQREKVAHMAAAKRIAHEAAEKARRLFPQLQEAKQVKTKEELEKEEAHDLRTRHKQLMTDLRQAFELARAEVNQIRLKRWEAEQHALGKQALDEMLDKSQMLLDQRRRRQSSEAFTVEGTEVEFDDDEEGSFNEEDENLSESDDSSDDGDIVDEDAHLTAEELRAKYAHIQALDEGSDQETEEDPSSEADSLDEQGMSEIEDEVELVGTPGIDEDDDMDLVEDRIPASPGADSATHVEHTSLVNDVLHSPQPTDLSYNGQKIGYSQLELEDVDEMLLDDSEADSITTEESDDDSDEEGESDEDSDEEDEGLAGFFSKAQLQKMYAGVPLADDSNVDLKETARPGKEAQTSGTEEISPMTNGVEKVHGDAEMTEPDSVDASFSVPDDALDGNLPKQEPEAQSTIESESSAAAQDIASSPEPHDDDIEEIPREARDDSNRVQVPFLLRGKLREYQHDGLSWLVGLYNGQTNGILADEMGLGKTIQTISLLAYLAVERGIWGPHLVVVPTSVMLNWEMEFKKFLPGFKILTYYGTIEERKKKRLGWLNDDLYNVVITSYQLILQDAVAFKRRSWHYLILDEAHNIKNFKSMRWQTLLTFKTDRRLLLTGTPLQNSLDELWSLLAFLMPTNDDGTGGFADLYNFTNAMSKPTNQILEQGKQELDAEGQARVKQLHEVLRPYILRRLKADVEKQMPGKYEHVVYCRLSKRQRQLYDGFMGRTETRQALSSGNYMSVMNCLMSLRKVCNHPDLFETRQIVTSFAMPRSVVADFEIKDLIFRKRLLEDADRKVDLDFLNLLPASKESSSALHAIRTRQIRAIRPLEDLVSQQSRFVKSQQPFNGSSADSVQSYLAQQASASHLEHLRTCLSVTRQRTDRLPVYGKGLINRLSINVNDRFILRSSRRPTKSAEWYMSSSTTLLDMVPTVEERAMSSKPIVQKFACLTPAVVASDLAPLAVSERGMEMIRASPWARKDPFHEARIRLSIAFPDKRLLQYDCGKLQRLEKLLRDLQAGGHRALIFTQMTKVLDILEQFLNIHGHRYLRLDGATKVEQRQILCDTFNNDNRILAFILSSRSGGLGLNLTGADTVIFYDLDWNPAMDKQCQDRAHRIGQTRDVHIYRFVSEYTVEANILRKSNQKRLLDDVIIQKGDFTTDTFHKISYKDALDDDSLALDEDAEASAAFDKVLGDAAGLTKVLDSVEDQEDVAAAKVAQKEIINEVHIDDADFNEGTTPKTSTSVPPTPSDPYQALAHQDTLEAVKENYNEERPHIDEYMVAYLDWELKDVPVQPPGDRKKRKARHGRDPRVRRRR